MYVCMCCANRLLETPKLLGVLLQSTGVNLRKVEKSFNSWFNMQIMSTVMNCRIV